MEINWDFLWTSTPDGLLLDSNGDGDVDGIAACLVPLTPERFTAEVWAAAVNLAARLGLESAAIRLPIALPLDKAESWQIPLLLSVGETPPAPWGDAAIEPILTVDGRSVAWMVDGSRRALQIHADGAADLADLLNGMAVALPETPTAEIPAATDSGDLDLAALYDRADTGLFAAVLDGHTRDTPRFRLYLGSQTDAVTGMAAVDLAARLGLETAGLALPLAFAVNNPPIHADEFGLLLGFPAEDRTLRLPGADQLLPMDAMTAHYLAEVYPFLDGESQRQGDTIRSLRRIIAAVEDLVYARTPLTWLALAETQAGRPLAQPGSNLIQEIFRLTWDPDDGLDHPARLRRVFGEEVRPALRCQSDPPQQITFFCSAPQPMRLALAAEFAAALRKDGRTCPVRVLPVHKAGLAWLQEEQIPILRAKWVAGVEIAFAEFGPADDEVKWLDLPHRWLQELFPADEVMARQLGLPLDQIDLTMTPAAQIDDAVYRLNAFDAAGEIIHCAALPLLWEERPYLAPMPEQGRVHPSAGGVIVDWENDARASWPVATDESLFWTFYQEEVLLWLRGHILAVGQRRSPIQVEPYFESLVVEGFFGWPDEPLGIHEEFVSVGEALHEDIYFNTLDYFAALGERFSGQPITAAGQVMPMIHHYHRADGSTVGGSPRAVVTLRSWIVPRFLKDRGMIVGSRHDMPTPQRVRLDGLAVDERGERVIRAEIGVDYADVDAAQLAAQVIRRWRDLNSEPHFPARIEVIVHCGAGERRESIHFAASPVDPLPTPEQIDAVDSAVIGPIQLVEELNALAALPGMRIWEVGRSYQGRVGYGVDVTLPIHAGQTHFSRLKLTVQKPTCLLIARHHANEVSSTTALLTLARDLATDPNYRALLARVNVVILPIANPDGAAFHYRLMAEHPRWKHHAARFNAAGKEFAMDTFNPATLFGEARFRRDLWSAWLPDAIVDNHGVPSHEWSQPFAGYNTPPRFQVSYHVVQAMLYGIVTYIADPRLPQLAEAAEAVRAAIAQAVAETPWLSERNRYWLHCYERYGHCWNPEVSPLQTHNGMICFMQGVQANHPRGERSFAGVFPSITLVDWITEVPDETAQGDSLAECALAQRTADEAMLRLLAHNARPVQRQVYTIADGRTLIRFHRQRRLVTQEEI
ncbi:MAG: hypothetical protein KF893_19570 [Caldilineaceae bacterium]|nr:hypothetical protein [Caldilineaceae bacterium]